MLLWFKFRVCLVQRRQCLNIFNSCNIRVSSMMLLFWLMIEVQERKVDRGYWGQFCWGWEEFIGIYFFVLFRVASYWVVSILLFQGSQICVVGVRGQLWVLVRICWVFQFVGRFWERNLFLFGWIYWFFSFNKGIRVQFWLVYFVYLLLQFELGTDLGSRRKEEFVIFIRVGVRWRLFGFIVYFVLFL